MGNLQKGLMAAGIGGALGVAASFGGGKLMENSETLRSRWYALPLVLLAGGGFAYAKGYQKVGIALGAAAGIVGYAGYANQAGQTAQSSGWTEAGRTSAWPARDSGAFEAPAPNAGALLGQGATQTMREGAGALLGRRGTDAMGLGR